MPTISARISQTDDSALPRSPVVLDRPTVLLLGSEGNGVPQDLCALSTHRLLLRSGRRQLHESIDSLNVAVAAALMVNHIMATRISTVF